MAAGTPIESSRLQLAYFIQVRVRMLMLSGWRLIENEWKAACNQVLGHGTYYDGTNAVRDAALKGMQATIIQSIRTIVYPGDRILLMGSFSLNEDAVTKLFREIGPLNAERKGGYTRITKLGQRRSDASEMAVIEWVDAPAAPEAATPAPTAKKAVKAPKAAKEDAAPAADAEAKPKKAPAKKKKTEGEA